MRFQESDVNESSSARLYLAIAGATALASFQPGCRRLRRLGVLLLAAASLACVTDGDVAQLTLPIGVAVAPMTELDARVGALEQQYVAVGALASTNAGRLAATSELVERADQRAVEAELMARGSLDRDVVFELDDVPFASSSAALTETSRSWLDQLGERLRMEDSGYFLEICGGGSERLGRARAEAIRRHLYEHHGLPLWRMNTVAGDCAPSPDGSAEPQPTGARIAVVRQAPRPPG